MLLLSRGRYDARTDSGAGLAEIPVTENGRSSLWKRLKFNIIPANRIVDELLKKSGSRLRS
jgi:hypothetical protein